jgi:hypothetical protein
MNSYFEVVTQPHTRERRAEERREKLTMVMKIHVPNYLLVLVAIASIFPIVTCGGSHGLVSAFGRTSSFFGRPQSASNIQHRPFHKSIRSMSHCNNGNHVEVEEPKEPLASFFTTRRSACQGVVAAVLVVLDGRTPARAAVESNKSYSSNARNMNRLAGGDGSGGSTYDNDPVNPAARKRRAMTGCKIPAARDEASGSSSMSETECNRRVLSGDTDGMLQAMTTLDCPTCPYGVATTRTK